ncbi:hypothetical protein ACFLW8_04615 [Chloroflexota bacterium]
MLMWLNLALITEAAGHMLMGEVWDSVGRNMADIELLDMAWR